jgi:hypothetical protein
MIANNIMDNTTAGIVAVVGIVLSGASTILAIANHKRVRSNCCGKKLEISLDVENTTPPPSVIPSNV